MRKALRFACMISNFYLLFACNMENKSDADKLPKDSTTLAKGKNSFVNNCSTCHNLQQDGTAPHLAGLTRTHSVEWIRNFIRDPKKVIDSGDTTAIALYHRYKTMMPPFSKLSDEEINSIISFVHSEKFTGDNHDTNDIKNPIPDSITTSNVVADLSFFTQIPASAKERPLARIVKMDLLPGTDQMFILDLRGKLYKLENREPKVYMDMAALKPKFVDDPGLNAGFGSFAFHPDFAKNGIIYTTHSEAPGSAIADYGYADSIPVAVQWVITEWKTDPSAFPFKGTDRELLRINMPSAIHGVQDISFNPLAKKGSPDYGLLYVGIGDGGGSEVGHPLVSEIPDDIWGSVIRIDPFGHNSKNGRYGIPNSNPFATTENRKFAGEVYAWGFRNPHRYTWTKAGQFLVANIGQANIESVNLVTPGRFFGWPLREGEFTEHFFKEIGKIFPLPANDTTFHITYPIAAFDHDEGTAIAGGFEYTGSEIPELKGKYVFNDIATGKLFFIELKDIQQGKKATIKKWNITFEGRPTNLMQLAKTERVEARFGRDKNGELYLFTKADGKVYKVGKLKK